MNLFPELQQLDHWTGPPEQTAMSCGDIKNMILVASPDSASNYLRFQLVGGGGGGGQWGGQCG